MNAANPKFAPIPRWCAISGMSRTATYSALGSGDLKQSRSAAGPYLTWKPASHGCSRCRLHRFARRRLPDVDHRPDHPCAIDRQLAAAARSRDLMEKATQSDGRTGNVLCAAGRHGRGGVVARRGDSPYVAS
jgi:hypothetical protein